MSDVYLRRIVAADRAGFLSSVARSKRLHGRWVNPPASPRQFAAFIERMALPANHCFLVCTRHGDGLAGVINITHIVRGAFCSGYLDYYAFAGFEQQGLMKQGLSAVVRRAFSTLKLHRLEANVQPANSASIGLVRACGFQREGYSPRYLKINGRWRDHERWAILVNHR